MSKRPTQKETGRESLGKPDKPREIKGLQAQQAQPSTTDATTAARTFFVNRNGGAGRFGCLFYFPTPSTRCVQRRAFRALETALQRGGIINGPVSDDCDLAGYRARFGEKGLQELLGKQRAVLEGLTIRHMAPEDVVEQLEALASDHGTSLRTLYRWMDAYEEKGLPGIMRAMSRKGKGTRPSICAAAYQYAYGLYCNEVKRTATTIYNKLVDLAAAMGPSACKKCIFCEGTDARRSLLGTGEINQYPPCTDPDKQGMRVPECRQTLSRMLAAIPADEVTLARRGVKAWKDDHMMMGVRSKPGMVNQVWFGDHHQFDCFVLDETGNPVRPWLTAW